MHIDRIPVYRAYQRTVDLDLYHAFAELVVLRSLDDQFSKCMVKIQINSPLICPVNRYPIDMH